MPNHSNTTVQFVWANCTDCPHIRTKRASNTVYASNYYCKATDNKIIATYIELESEIPPVPEWCPHRIKSA